MVHVEVFIGGESGEETIGARWQKGHVQVHSSYKFKSKNYTDVKPGDKIEVFDVREVARKI